jgi:hypothetical protein
MKAERYVKQIIYRYILGVCEDGWKIKNLEPVRVRESIPSDGIVCKSVR